MPTVQIRDLDEGVYRRLLDEAKKNHRSLSGQAAAILGETPIGEANRKEARRSLLRRIEASEDVWPETLPTPDSLIREDRDR